MKATLYVEELRALVARLGWDRQPTGRSKRSPLHATLFLEVGPASVRATVVGEDFTATRSGDVVANLVEPGAVALYGSRFAAFLKTVKSATLTVESVGSSVRLVGGTTRADLVSPDVWDLSDPPRLPDPPGGVTFVADAAKLSRDLRRVLPFVSRDEFRRNIQGVLVEAPGVGSGPQSGGTAIRLVATDGHRLSVLRTCWDALRGSRASLPPLSRKEGEPDHAWERRQKEHEEMARPRFILAQRGVKALTDLLGTRATGTVTIRAFCGRDWLVVSYSGAAVAVRLIDDLPVNWEQVVPDDAKLTATVTVEPSGLADAARTMLTLKDYRTGLAGALVERKGSALVLTYKAGDVGRVEASVPASEAFGREDYWCGINPTYILDAACALSGSSTLRVRGSDEFGAVVIDGDDAAEFVHLVMPTRAERESYR